MRTAVIAMLGLVAATGPILALDGPGRTLLPSPNNIGASNDPVLTGAAGDSIERGFIPAYSGLVRVQWEVRSSDGGEVASRAEAAHIDSCVKTSAATSFVIKICNLRVKSGMPIVISAQPNDDTTQVSLRNVRIYHRVVDSDGKTVTFNVQSQADQR